MKYFLLLLLALPPLPAVIKHLRKQPSGRADMLMAKVQIKAPQPPLRHFLVFSNADVGPLFYHAEIKLAMNAPWALYSSGVAMPGETSISLATTNAQAFFRVGWVQ